MNFSEFLKNNIVMLDGGMGTLLQEYGLKLGEYPEEWNITHSQVIKNIHIAYFNAGSNVVCTNTFGANVLKFGEDKLENVIKAAVENANAAKDECCRTKEKFVALDIGPLGKLLKPYGDLEFEEAVNIFKKTVGIGVKYGVDLVLIETMNDSYETKAALLAAKESCDLPVLVSNAYGEDGKLMTGATPEAMIAMLEGLGADAIGVNCSLGPKQMGKIIDKYLKYASVPVLMKPNAGLPKSVDGRTVFDVSAEEFVIDVLEKAKDGVSILGGCCGTTPEYIKRLGDRLLGFEQRKVPKKHGTVISSYSHAVSFGKKPLLCGERINPTGKKRFKQALIENDISYILSEGIKQQDKGVHILDVNVGIPDIDEAKVLPNVVSMLQGVTDLPLQIDTTNPVALEKALRVYNGKALINSVNGKKESMDTVFPLIKKYGGVVVALTLDENGIPSSAQEKLKIARKIIKTAKSYGIDKRDIIFDVLTMAVSADGQAATNTLEALELIKKKLGCYTTLGVSNVSFGLPSRNIINSVFFVCALERGLDSAIMNPQSEAMLNAYYGFCALHSMDKNCEEYIKYSQSIDNDSKQNTVNQQTDLDDAKNELQYAIIKGLKEQAAGKTKEMLVNVAPLEIVQNEIIPALNFVGKGFENGTTYLPQLLMSAEAAKSAFEEIKTKLPADNVNKQKLVVLATVKGDIHDIGKNIVKLLLENYGFYVVDLGKDVSPENILQAVKENNARLLGLSALMTTTVESMEKTIVLLNKEAPNCKIVVGGAVLNKDYAEKIGADKYAKDAMETVRYAEEIFK